MCVKIMINGILHFNSIFFYMMDFEKVNLMLVTRYILGNSNKIYDYICNCKVLWFWYDISTFHSNVSNFLLATCYMVAKSLLEFPYRNNKAT